MATPVARPMAVAMHIISPVFGLWPSLQTLRSCSYDAIPSSRQRLLHTHRAHPCRLVKTGPRHRKNRRSSMPLEPPDPFDLILISRFSFSFVRRIMYNSHPPANILRIPRRRSQRLTSPPCPGVYTRVVDCAIFSRTTHLHLATCATRRLAGVYSAEGYLCFR